MGDFKFIAFVIFFIIFFSYFVSLYTNSQYEYGQDVSYNQSLNETDISSFETLKNASDIETFSIYGKMFISGIGILVGFVILRFIRGQ